MYEGYLQVFIACSVLDFIFFITQVLKFLTNSVKQFGIGFLDYDGPTFMTSFDQVCWFNYST